MAVQITEDVVANVKSVLRHTVDKPGLEPNFVLYVENQLNIGLPLMRLIIMEMIHEVSTEAMTYIDSFHAEYNTLIPRYAAEYTDKGEKYAPWGAWTE